MICVSNMIGMNMLYRRKCLYLHCTVYNENILQDERQFSITVQQINNIDGITICFSLIQGKDI